MNPVLLLILALAFTGAAHAAGDAAAGQSKAAVCAACHGMDGKGNQALGAPKLTDNIWLYGGSERAITETLTHGRTGVMPSFKKTLGDDKIHVVATYVYSLSH